MCSRHSQKAGVRRRQGQEGGQWPDHGGHGRNLDHILGGLAEPLEVFSTGGMWSDS